MDFLTLINLLLISNQVTARSEPGPCPKFLPLKPNIPSFHGRVIAWIPDNNGFNPFNSYDLWHFRFGYPLEMFVTSSESIALNVTLRCQQSNPTSGALPPQSVWTGRQQDPIEWSEENFGLYVDNTTVFLTGCKQLTFDSKAFGTIYAISQGFEHCAPEWNQNRNDCNFVNEFVIARTSVNLVEERVYRKNNKDDTYIISRFDSSGAKEFGSEWKLMAIGALVIFINSCNEMYKF